MIASKRTRVYIADDNHRIRTFLRTFIDRNPDMLVVGEAQDGEQALQGVDSTHPDVILLDIQMPKIDGLEVFQRLQSNAVPVQIIFLSGCFSEAQYRACPELQAWPYISKSADPDVIIATIRSLTQDLTVSKSPLR